MAKKFGGFTEQQKEVLARRMGYNGPIDQFGKFLQSSPAHQQKFLSYESKAKQMVEGAAPQQPKPETGFATGGVVTDPATPTNWAGTTLTKELITNPESVVTPTKVEQIQTSPDQMISPTAGQVAKTPDVTSSAGASTAQVAPVVATTAPAVATATTTAPVTSAVKGMQAAQGTVSDAAQMQAAQQNQSSIANMQAAQTQAYLLQNPVQRQIEQGELISGSAVDATKVEQLNKMLTAAEATPSTQATVQGQLAGLMTQFEGGKTPAWAAGAMRQATAVLAQRGLTASSMAGQAVVQAAMESALPIAQADASTRAQFESQNLSNRQQVAMFAAQQRASFLQQEFDQTFQSRVLNAAKVSDVANMNFTAEQQIALENSRAVNTVNLANLDANQAMVLAKASALANLDMANLSNRQQQAVQNAQAFLQMDLANLDANQQMTMFKSQSIVQSMFTDQAAENATRQFNASSQGQTDQFFASLGAQVQQFNAAQTNAMEQFRVGQTDAVSMFNRQMNDAAEQFNASNRLIIDQSNAEWRRAVTTANNAAINEANRIDAQTASNMTLAGYNNLMQRERDFYSFAFTAAENDLNRANELALAKLGISAAQKEASATRTAGMWSAVGSLGAAVVEGLFN